MLQLYIATIRLAYSMLSNYKTRAPGAAAYGISYALSVPVSYATLYPTVFSKKREKKGGQKKGPMQGCQRRTGKKLLANDLFMNHRHTEVPSNNHYHGTRTGYRAVDGCYSDRTLRRQAAARSWCCPSTCSAGSYIPTRRSARDSIPPSRGGRGR